MDQHNFSIFIDDMADYVNNMMIQFADDTKLWNKTDTEEERESIQSDLQSLSEWSQRWKLKFNPKKCKVLHLGAKNTKFVY